MSKLGGYLVGYGILRKGDKEPTQVLFDTPVHNTITKAGLNNLLMFDGTNTTASTNFDGNYCSLFFKSSGTSDRYGIFNSCALGDGTGTTSVDATDLTSRKTAITSTRYTGSSWNGTTLDSPNATIKLRVSHLHSITEPFSIREIGWFNQSNAGNTYTLSSRVLLDTPIAVDTGDSFISIYEVNVSFQDVERFSNFAGLEGIKTNAMIRTGDGGLAFPYVDSNGMSYTDIDWLNNRWGCNSTCPFVPVWYNRTYTCDWHTYSVSQSQICKLCAVDIQKEKPFMSYGNRGFYAQNTGISIDIQNYTIDSFYRDVIITLAPDYFVDKSFYGISIYGAYYRFGTFSGDTFTPAPVTLSSGLRLTLRQSWSTDLLTPSA